MVLAVLLLVLVSLILAINFYKNFNKENFVYYVDGCEENEERRDLSMDIKTPRIKYIEKDVVGGFLVLNFDYAHSCCAKLKIENEISSEMNATFIKLKIKNEGEICRCLCNYKINASIKIGKEKYVLQIYELYQDNEETKEEIVWEENLFEKFCESDVDCACGTHIESGECFYGNKDFVNTLKQCYDFCTGIHGRFRIKCVNKICKQVISG